MFQLNSSKLLSNTSSTSSSFFSAILPTKLLFSLGHFCLLLQVSFYHPSLRLCPHVRYNYFYDCDRSFALNNLVIFAIRVFLGRLFILGFLDILFHYIFNIPVTIYLFNLAVTYHFCTLACLHLFMWVYSSNECISHNKKHC